MEQIPHLTDVGLFYFSKSNINSIRKVAIYLISLKINLKIYKFYRNKFLFFLLLFILYMG